MVNDVTTKNVKSDVKATVVKESVCARLDGMDAFVPSVGVVSLHGGFSHL